MFLAWSLAVVALIWFSLSAFAMRNLLAAPRLPALAELPRFDKQPFVSVIIAARDEAARIEQTVRGLLAQQAVQLQVVVVDDRSTDETPQILARLAATDPRVTVVRVDELPAGWLGKCHACARGATQAQGEGLLFTDGDIHMGADVVARAIAVAVREQADHLAMWPAVNTIA